MEAVLERAAYLFSRARFRAGACSDSTIVWAEAFERKKPPGKSSWFMYNPPSKGCRARSLQKAILPSGIEGDALRNKTVKIGLSVIVAVLGLGLMAWSLSRSSGTYVKVDELAKRRTELVGKSVWLGGKVVLGSHLWHPGGGERQPEHRFQVEWKGKKVEVRYRGRIPSGFQPGRQVTLRGRLTSDGFFLAEEVTTKCPSKYQSRQ